MSHNFDPFPKYLQIRDIVTRELRDLAVGEKLPTEAQLAGRFGVSRETIRQALNALEADGLIRRRPRIGTVLARPLRPAADARVTGPVEDFAMVGVVTTTAPVDERRIAADADLAVRLDLHPGAEILALRRLRLHDGIPLNLLEAFLPSGVANLLEGSDLTETLLIPVLRGLHDPGIAEEYQEIEAVAATTDIARWLQVAAGAPVLTVRRRFLDSAGVPVAYFKVHYRSDRYFYTIKLPQNRRETPSRKRPRRHPQSAGKSP